MLDPEFSESNFGCRPRRAAHGAIRQVKAFVKSGYRVAVELALEKFFDMLNHDVLMSRIARQVTRETYVPCTVEHLHQSQHSELGIPGSPRLYLQLRL